MKIKRVPFFVVTLGLLWNIAIVAAQDQAPAPVFKEGDTWQFNISRKGGSVTSTELLERIYQLSFMQGKMKLYKIRESQKAEFEI